MSGQTEKTTQAATTQVANTNQTTGPEQWMRDTGQGLYQQAADGIPTSFTPYGGERVAGMGPTYDQAKGIIQGLTGPSQDLTTAGTVLDSLRTAPGNDVTKSVGDYVNPYVEGTLNPTLRHIHEAQDAEQLQNNQAATMAGAFGDPQQGIARAITNDKFNNQIGDATSKAYSDAWNAGQAQQNTVLSRMMQLPGLYSGLDTSKFNRSTALSRYLTSFGQTDQAQGQAQDNVNYENWQQQNGGYATNRVNVLMQLLNQTPHQTTQNGTQVQQGNKVEQTTQPDNSLLQVGGKLAGTALGAYLGGPAGAQMGSTLGGSLFGSGGGSAGGGLGGENLGGTNGGGFWAGGNYI